MPKLSDTNAYSNEDMPAKAAARTELAQQEILTNLVKNTPAPSWATGLNPMLYQGGVGYTDPKTGSAYDPAGKLVYEVPKIRSGMDDLGNISLAVLSLVYPPIAPFVQAYNAVKAIDEGNVLGFILNAAGAGAKIPGLDASTAKLLNDVSTGARIIKAVESKDPLAIASSMVNLPGVPVDVKNTLDIVNAAKAISRGDINALIGVAQKYGSSVSKTADTVTVDGTIYDINNTPAGFSNTPESSMTTTLDAQIASNLRGEGAARDQTNTSDQIDKLDATTDDTKTIDQVLTDAGLVSDDVVNANTQKQQNTDITTDLSDKTIEDTLTDAGLVSNTDNVQSLDSVEVTGKGQSQDKITDKTIDDELTDAGLVSNTDGIDSLNAVTVLGTKDLKALTTDDISSLTTTDIDTLINTGIDSLDKVTVLGTKDVKALNTDYIDTLTSSNIAALTTDDIYALDKVTVLGTKDVAVLNTDYIDTLTTKDLTALDKVTILGTKDIAALTTDDIYALDKVTVLGTKDLTALTTKDLTALTTQSVKTLPKVTLPKITPTKPTDVVGTETKKTTPPAEQLYQTTTQSNPTTPQEIKYFLDMIGSDILPPTTQHNPLESLLNQSSQPMSLDELLRHLRS